MATPSISGKTFVDPALADVAAGKTRLTEGDKGEAVTKMQEALQMAGAKLPRSGIDGDFGSGTAAAIKKFQSAHGLKPNGQLDKATLEKLSSEATKFPEYDKLFADGKLETTIAIGHDEGNKKNHVPVNYWPKQEIKDVESGLKSKGYTEIDPKTATAEQMRAVGIDPATVDKDVRYFTKTFQYKGKDVKSVVKFITPFTLDAKDKFATAMRTSELVLYGGHGRYGSGPDFDDIKSPRGNFVIGKPYEAGHVTLNKGETDLKRTALPKSYQLMMFSGCTTHHYLDELRSVPGKDSKNLDLMVSSDLLYWDNSGDNALAMLNGVTSGLSINEIESNLETINKKPGKESVWQADGFKDNK